MITTKLTIECRELDTGKLLKKIEQPGRSFLLNFMHGMFGQFGAGDSAATVVKDITNTGRTVRSYTGTTMIPCHLGINAPPGNSSLFAATFVSSGGGGQYVDSELVGIVLGTGNTAVTPADYKAETRIAHGLAAGQVLYSGCGCDTLTFADPNGSFIIRRLFTNVSGGNITVNEVALYTIMYSQSTTQLGHFCIYRDIIGGGLAIVNGNVVVVTITVQITV
ncbi:MAG: hypothetical protein WC455_19740 [Dehalococcoidia bacterium]|jgi:hypothetical protein